MKFIINKYHNKVPDKLLLADLRKTARRLKRKHIGLNDYDAAGEYASGTLSKRFGGWNEALVKAGLQVKKINKISDDELMMNLKKVWISLGRQPKFEEMKCPLSLFYPTTYARRYGSWRRTLFVFVKRVKHRKFRLKNRAIYNNYRNLKGPVKKQGAKIIKSHVTKGMRFDVIKRDKYKCRLCGASPAKDPDVILHVDHIIPAAKGGKSVLSNLQTLCSDCNLGKAAKSDH